MGICPLVESFPRISRQGRPANVGPAMLADNKEGWSSLYHALGFNPTEPKSAKSIPISDVFRRLVAILPEFNKEHADFVFYILAPQQRASLW